MISSSSYNPRKSDNMAVHPSPCRSTNSRSLLVAVRCMLWVSWSCRLEKKVSEQKMRLVGVFFEKKGWELQPNPKRKKGWLWWSGVFFMFFIGDFFVCMFVRRGYIQWSLFFSNQPWWNNIWIFSWRSSKFGWSRDRCVCCFGFCFEQQEDLKDLMSCHWYYFAG